jgi:hypothetical protein
MGSNNPARTGLPSIASLETATKVGNDDCSDRVCRGAYRGLMQHRVVSKLTRIKL